MKALSPVLVGLALSTTLVACGTTTPSPTSPVAGCPKVKIAAILHVDPGDPRGVWGTELSNGQLISVRPRSDLGWTVERGADPGTLVAPDGTTATFDGEIFRQACYDEATGAFFIGPEDLPDPNRPPG